MTALSECSSEESLLALQMNEITPSCQMHSTQCVQRQVYVYSNTHSSAAEQENPPPQTPLTVVAKTSSPLRLFLAMQLRLMRSHATLLTSSMVGDVDRRSSPSPAINGGMPASLLKHHACKLSIHACNINHTSCKHVSTPGCHIPSYHSSGMQVNEPPTGPTAPLLSNHR